MPKKTTSPAVRRKRRRGPAFIPVNVFNHSTLTSLLEEVRQHQTLMELADRIGVSHQSVHKTLLGEEHRVLNHVTGWKRALRLKRLEGEYFELLAIIAAYPESKRRERLLKRSFHLLGRLEDRLNSRHELAASLLYWVDPLCPILRNSVELADFPAVEREIPSWVLARVTTLSGLMSSETALKGRINLTWNWLKQIGAVSLDKGRGRWTKKESTTVSVGKIGPHVKDMQSAILTMLFVNIFRDFTLVMGTDRIVAAKTGTFSLSSRHFDLLREVVMAFVLETVSCLNYACNPDDLERLRTTDPGQHAKISAYLDSMKQRGFTISPCTDADVDSVVQIVMSARRVI